MSASIKSLLIGLLLIVISTSPLSASHLLLGVWKNASGEVEVTFFEEDGAIKSESTLYSGEEAVVKVDEDRYQVNPVSGTISFSLFEDGLLLESEDAKTILTKAVNNSADLVVTRGSVIPEVATRGMITGFPTGPAKSTAGIFRVYLYDLDQQATLIGSQRLDTDHGFVFENLRPGRYRVYFAAQGPTVIQPEPAFRDLTVEGGSITEQNVTLD